MTIHQKRNKDWKDSGQKLVYALISPFIKLCVAWKITPNMITVIGLIINIIAAIVLIIGAEIGHKTQHFYVGIFGVVVLFAGLMDMVDGHLARITNTSSRYGAMFDSVLDRYSEMFMFLGICYYLVYYQYFLSSLFGFIAMIGSIMVSYTRARAEGLGIKMEDIGFMQRPERIILIASSAILCSIMSMVLGNSFKIKVQFLPFPLIENITFFTFPILILAILSNYSAVERLYFAKKRLI